MNFAASNEPHKMFRMPHAECHLPLASQVQSVAAKTFASLNVVARFWAKKLLSKFFSLLVCRITKMRILIWQWNWRIAFIYVYVYLIAAKHCLVINRYNNLDNLYIYL